MKLALTGPRERGLDMDSPSRGQPGPGSYGHNIATDLEELEGGEGCQGDYDRRAPFDCLAFAGDAVEMLGEFGVWGQVGIFFLKSTSNADGRE